MASHVYVEMSSVYVIVLREIITSYVKNTYVKRLRERCLRETTYVKNTCSTLLYSTSKKIHVYVELFHVYVGLYTFYVVAAYVEKNPYWCYVLPEKRRV